MDRLLHAAARGRSTAARPGRAREIGHAAARGRRARSARCTRPRNSSGMHPDDEPPDDGVVYAPAPSPEEVAAACSGPVGWRKAHLAKWGVTQPPPKGWRAELARRHRLGLDVEPLDIGPRERESRNRKASWDSTGVPVSGTA